MERYLQCSESLSRSQLLLQNNINLNFTVTITTQCVTNRYLPHVLHFLPMHPPPTSVFFLIAILTYTSTCALSLLASSFPAETKQHHALLSEKPLRCSSSLSLRLCHLQTAGSTFDPPTRSFSALSAPDGGGHHAAPARPCVSLKSGKRKNLEALTAKPNPFIYFFNLNPIISIHCAWKKMTKKTPLALRTASRGVSRRGSPKGPDCVCDLNSPRCLKLVIKKTTQT